MADLIDLAAKNWYGGGVKHKWTALADGDCNMAAGYRWADYNCVICIRFTLPTPAKSITLSFCNASGGTKIDQNLRYKFTQEEDMSLNNADSNVPGDGDFTLKCGDWVRNTVTIQKILPAGTHYLYIWTNNSSELFNVMWIPWLSTGNYRFIGTFEELTGLDWIKDGGVFKPYHEAIKTGGEWKIYAPYVFKQGKWNALN